jgi:hypothetical protein
MATRAKHRQEAPIRGIVLQVRQVQETVRLATSLADVAGGGEHP